MNVTPEQCQEAVNQSGIKTWSTRGCSFCNYPVGYLFQDGKVFFDKGCSCARYFALPEPREWQDVANHINRQNEIVSDRFWAELNGGVDC